MLYSKGATYIDNKQNRYVGVHSLRLREPPLSCVCVNKHHSPEIIGQRAQITSKQISRPCCNGLLAHICICSVFNTGQTLKKRRALLGTQHVLVGI